MTLRLIGYSDDENHIILHPSKNHPNCWGINGWSVVGNSAVPMLYSRNGVWVMSSKEARNDPNNHWTVDTVFDAYKEALNHLTDGMLVYIGKPEQERFILRMSNRADGFPNAG